MSLLERLRTMDKPLRVTLIGTALLIVPVIGQLVAMADLRRTGHEGDLALFFMFAAIFIVPTSLILSCVILLTSRREWRKHSLLTILGGANLLIALEIIWFFFASATG